MSRTSHRCSRRSAGAKQAAAEAGRMFGPAAEASKAGDNVQAAFRLVEGALPLQPGEAARQPEQWQARWRDNARTVPLLFAAPPPSVSCDALREFARPTLVVVGQETKLFFPVIAERVRECVPGAERVVLGGVGHGTPLQDPAAFSDAVHAFISKH
jgi:pimeloyl-ACP methyl ester carboxylesterase